MRTGDVPVAVVIPKGLGEAFSQNGFAGGGPSIQLLSDVSDPIAPQMVLGLLQKVAMTAAPDLLMQGGMRQFEEACRRADAAAEGRGRRVAAAAEGAGAVRRRGARHRHRRDADRRRGRRRHAHRQSPGSLVSFYAAGIGVMFLLFSTVGAAPAARCSTRPSPARSSGCSRPTSA